MSELFNIYQENLDIILNKVQRLLSSTAHLNNNGNK